MTMRALCFLLVRCCCRDCSDRQRTPGQSLHLTAMPLSGATSLGGFMVSSVGVSSPSSLSSSSSSSSSFVVVVIVVVVVVIRARVIIVTG